MATQYVHKEPPLMPFPGSCSESLCLRAGGQGPATDYVQEAPHICGDDCAGTWHMLDERMGTRRA